MNLDLIEAFSSMGVLAVVIWLLLSRERTWADRDKEATTTISVLVQKQADREREIGQWLAELSQGNQKALDNNTTALKQLDDRLGDILKQRDDQTVAALLKATESLCELERQRRDGHVDDRRIPTERAGSGRAGRRRQPDTDLCGTEMAVVPEPGQSG